MEVYSRIYSLVQRGKKKIIENLGSERVKGIRIWQSDSNLEEKKGKFSIEWLNNSSNLP